MGGDLVGAGAQWIPDAEYEFIESRVPIACVDVLLVSSGSRRKVGLILRDTYDGERGWCLVGGAVLRNEEVTSAALRHLKATLGAGVSSKIRALEFLGVFEYFTERRRGELYDPRKHAISITYSSRVSEAIEVAVTGEAYDFAWFGQDDVVRNRCGFGQEAVIGKYFEQA